MPHCQKENFNRAGKSKKERHKAKQEAAARKHQLAAARLAQDAEDELLKGHTTNNLAPVEGFGEYEIGCEPEPEYHKFNVKKRNKKHLRLDLKKAQQREQREEEERILQRQQEEYNEQVRLQQQQLLRIEAAAAARKTETGAVEEEEVEDEDETWCTTITATAQSSAPALEYFVFICECCDRRYATKNQFLNHIKSKKHLNRCKMYEELGLIVTHIELRGMNNNEHDTYNDNDNDNDHDNEKEYNGHDRNGEDDSNTSRSTRDDNETDIGIDVSNGNGRNEHIMRKDEEHFFDDEEEGAGKLDEEEDEEEEDFPKRRATNIFAGFVDDSSSDDDDDDESSNSDNEDDDNDDSMKRSSSNQPPPSLAIKLQDSPSCAKNSTTRNNNNDNGDDNDDDDDIDFNEIMYQNQLIQDEIDAQQQPKNDDGVVVISPTTRQPLPFNEGYDPSRYDVNENRLMSVQHRLRKNLAAKGIEPSSSSNHSGKRSDNDSYDPFEAIMLGKTLLQEVLEANVDDLDRKLAAYNRHKKECAVLGRHFALTKGNSKALPAQYVFKKDVSDNARQRANVHHAGSHYHMQMSRSMQFGRQKGLMARHSSQGSRLQASRRMAKMAEQKGAGSGMMKNNKTSSKKSSQKQQGRAGGSKKTGGSKNNNDKSGGGD